MLHMLDAFGRVVGTFRTSPGRPAGPRILNRVYTICFAPVVGFAAYAISP